MDHVGTALLYATVTINDSPLSVEIDTVTIASLEIFNAIYERESTLEN